MDIYDELFETPEVKEYPENHRPEFDFIDDILNPPKEKEFKYTDVSETMDVDMTFKRERKLLNIIFDD